jgi:hypothetical protein
MHENVHNEKSNMTCGKINLENSKGKYTSGWISVLSETSSMFKELLPTPYWPMGNYMTAVQN